MNQQQQVQASGPPIASSSRLPPIQILKHNHPFDDQAAAAAAAALLQIKRSPSSVHAPLLPSFPDSRPSYSNPYPPLCSPGGDTPSASSGSSVFPYLPPIRTDFQQYGPPGVSTANTNSNSCLSPAYTPLLQQYPSHSGAFHHFQYNPDSSRIRSAKQDPSSSPLRKRKRVSLPDHTSSSEISFEGKQKARELPIDVEGDGDAETDMEVTDMRHDDGEGDVRCICGFDVDDGFTIQCERCHVWQHAACFSILSIDAVPDVYLCERCDPHSSRLGRLGYEDARRLQQQRLGMGENQTGCVNAVGVELGARRGATVRSGARKKRSRSPKVERKNRNGLVGSTRKRNGSTVQQPNLLPDGMGGAGRKSNGSNGRRKEKESSPAIVFTQQLPPPSARLPATRSPVYSAALAGSSDFPNAHEEPWTEQYVPITQDIVHPAVRPTLSAFAHAWRGVTAFSPGVEVDATDELSPITSCIPARGSTFPHIHATSSEARKTFLHPLPATLSPPSRPPTYTLHALRPIARQSYVVPYTCAITPSREYLREPTSQYAQLGVPKQGVHLVPPPLELCLDARGVGGEGRWVRSGCHPNAVLRPVICGQNNGKRVKETEGWKELGLPEVACRDGQRVARSGGTETCQTDANNGQDSDCGGEVGSREAINDVEQDEEPEVTFGVFAIRDLKAEEEIVLGWEWDDRHVVHELPRLLKEGYGSGTPALKRAMGEVLSTLFSTFTTCACGASAHNCAITQMQNFAELESEVDSHPDPELLPREQQQHRTSNVRSQWLSHQSPDLGPLIGATRGQRTTDRGQGGREGVELLSTSPRTPSVESVARAFRGAASASDPVPCEITDDSALGPTTTTMTRRVHFPVVDAPIISAPEVIISPATTTAGIVTPSPRKSWERQYSESRSNYTSEDDLVEIAQEAERDKPCVEALAHEHKPPKKKARTRPRVSLNPPGDGPDGNSDVSMLEETLPPKMRKNWIKETLRVLNTEDQENAENSVGVQDKAMDDGEIDGPIIEEGIDLPATYDPTDVPLPSPSTALAGLSLRASPGAENLDPSPSNQPAESLVTPMNEVSPSTMPPVIALLETHTETVEPQPHSQLANVTSSAITAVSDSLTHSPPREALSAPAPVRYKSPIPNVTSVTPLLPSSAVNANSSPSVSHVFDAVPDGALDSQLLSASIQLASADATPLYNDDLIHEPSPSLPPPTPRKPPVKRRTLADWKSRKEKERVAQALLKPPPPAAAKNYVNDITATHDLSHADEAVSISPVVSTSLTGALIPIDVRMETAAVPGKTVANPPSPVPSKNLFEPRNFSRHRDVVVFQGKELVAPGLLNDPDRVTPMCAEKPPLNFSVSSGPAPSLLSRISHFPSELELRQAVSSISEHSSFNIEPVRKSSPGEFREDIETGTSVVKSMSPRSPSRHPSLPPSHPPSRPRSPPTQPRSFHTSSPPPSLPLSSPSTTRGGQPSGSNLDFRTNSHSRPVPSGPRALRNGYQPGSSSSSAYRGRGYSSRPPPPSGRANYYPHNRPHDREFDRGWPTRARGRGGHVDSWSVTGSADGR